MSAYIIRRLLSVIPITIGVLLITFFLFRVIGGNPAYRIAGKNATPERIAQISKERGYDKPYFLNLQNFPREVFDAQFPRLLSSLVRFDFGISASTKQPVSRMLREGFLPSLCLTVPLFVIDLVLAVALALLAAYYRDTWIDRCLVVLSVLGMSISSLVYIMVAQYWLASEWRLFPVWGFEGPQYLVLPVLIGVVAGVGGSVRFYRTIMLDEMYQEYVRTARAKGLGGRTILFRHVLRNALIPIMTNVIVAIPFLYTGSLLLENFFGIPGLGRMTVIAVFNGDEEVLFATTFIGAILFVLANLATDIAYTWADPRIRLR
ncbi:MAG: Glutathione transport system permease protein GsiC [Verrucomicrobiae bacterium]|nr:Glutathione transport system permease protein GsiC [Verrucomicrobiae bacterium]